jgi:hypothetical protein
MFGFLTPLFFLAGSAADVDDAAIVQITNKVASILRRKRSRVD